MTYTKVAASSQEDDDDDDAAAAINNYCTTGAGRRSQHSQQPSNGGTTTKTPETTGFSTEAALERLDEDIATLLSEYETVIRHERFVWFRFLRVFVCQIKIDTVCVICTRCVQISRCDRIYGPFIHN